MTITINVTRHNRLSASALIRAVRDTHRQVQLHLPVTIAFRLPPLYGPDELDIKAEAAE